MGYCRFDMRLWSSPRVIEALTSADQYLLFYLFTTPHTSFNGCCHINFRTLSFETGLDQEKIRHCLKRLYESGFILYCDGTKEAFVKGWISCNWGGAPRRGAKIYQAIQLIKFAILPASVFLRSRALLLIVMSSLESNIV